MKLPTWLYVILFVASLTGAGIGLSFHLHGQVNDVYVLLTFFLTTNLLVCIWEICLYFRHQFVEDRLRYWEQSNSETGRTPGIQYLLTRVTIQKAFTSKQWADAYAAYSVYDASYTDPRSCGFMVDVGNGFVTLLPTIFLLVTFTFDLVSSAIVGVVALVLSWQWIYVTAMYIASFFVGERHKLIPKSHTNVLIWGINLVWIALAILLGYVAIRLIFDGNYSVLAH